MAKSLPLAGQILCWPMTGFSDLLHLSPPPSRLSMAEVFETVTIAGDTGEPELFYNTINMLGRNSHLWVNPFSPLNFPMNMVLLSFSAIMARFFKQVPTNDFHQPVLNHSRGSPEDPFPFLGNLQLLLNVAYTYNWLQAQLMPSTWNCSMPLQNTLRLDFPGTSSDLKADKFFASLKERRLNYFSSRRERSIPPSSSDTERTFSSSPYSSFIEETFGVQPQILPLLVDTMAGFKARFLSNSTLFEPTFKSDSITSAILHRSDETHVDFYEILQICRNLEKCFISIFVYRFNSCTSWVVCFNLRVSELIVIVCNLKV